MSKTVESTYRSAPRIPSRADFAPAEPHRRIMILMRGLPSCGKTHTACQLASRGGAMFEFDEYFHKHVGDDPERFDWSDALLPDARRWFIDRVSRAVDRGVSPIIVDNDNTPHPSTHAYVSHAMDRGYTVEFREPDSPWWAEIRTLLQNKERHRESLDIWAEKLAEMSRATHRVPLSNFLRRIKEWKSDLTVEDIMRVGQRAKEQSVQTRQGASVVIDLSRMGKVS